MVARRSSRRAGWCSMELCTVGLLHLEAPMSLRSRPTSAGTDVVSHSNVLLCVPRNFWWGTQRQQRGRVNLNSGPRALNTGRIAQAESHGAEGCNFRKSSAGYQQSAIIVGFDFDRIGPTHFDRSSFKFIAHAINGSQLDFAEAASVGI